MEINLLPILNYEGRKIDILEDIEVTASKNDSFKILAPVHFVGSAVNIGKTIELTGKASASLSMICDRCADTYEQTLDFEIEERFKKEDELSSADENPDVTPLEGTIVKLDEIIYENLFLNIPSKSLCQQDCKGLCPICGQNLNNGICNCSNEQTDPRFDILDKLL